MFNGQRNFNNNGNSVNVNTKLFTSYSDAAMIVMGAWNTQFSLKIHPFKGVNADGVRQYAQDNADIVSTSITADNAYVLKEAVEKELEPAIKEGKACTVGVQVSTGDNRKSISLKYDGTDVYLVIAIGVSEAGAADPSNILEHKFNKRNYVLGYDPTTGAGEVKEVQSDYDKFISIIKNVDELLPLTAHSIKYNDKVTQSYNSRNANQQNFGNQNAGYQAPTANYGAGDMGSFIPSV